KNFTAMLRLDHNRALSQLAMRAGVPVGSIEKLVVWGNHSTTMYPDYRFATADGASLKAKINDDNWNRTVFIPTVGKRGAAVIDAFSREKMNATLKELEEERASVAPLLGK